MGLVCFFDNDIILKLAACDLFYDVVSSLGLEEADLRVRYSNQFYFKKKKKVSENYSEDIRNYAITIVQKSSKVQEELVDIEQLSNLQKIEGIDSGEAILTLAAMAEESFYIATSDKNYIEALAGATQIEAIKTKLSGRIICLEQAIKIIILSQGFEAVLTKVLPSRQCDKALHAIFGSGERCTQDNVMMSLDGYIQDLKNKSGDLLADF